MPNSSLLPSSPFRNDPPSTANRNQGPFRSMPIVRCVIERVPPLSSSKSCLLSSKKAYADQGSFAFAEKKKSPKCKEGVLFLHFLTRFSYPSHQTPCTASTCSRIKQWVPLLKSSHSNHRPLSWIYTLETLRLFSFDIQINLMIDLDGVENAESN